MKGIFEEMIDSLMKLPLSNWNLVRAVKGFINSKIGGFANITKIDYKNLSNEYTHSEEYMYLGRLFTVLFHLTFFKETEADWSTKNVGTFLVHAILQTTSRIEIHDAFLQSTMNVSIPDIVHMYNVMDYRALNTIKLSTPRRFEEPEPCDYWDLFSNCDQGGNAEITSYSAFSVCFQDIMNRTEDDEHSFELDDLNSYSSGKFKQASPCTRLDQYPRCQEYCDWHNDYIRNVSSKELLTMMKYASPLGKTKHKGSKMEKILAGKIESCKECCYLIT